LLYCRFLSKLVTPLRVVIKLADLFMPA